MKIIWFCSAAICTLLVRVWLETSSILCGLVWLLLLLLRYWKLYLKKRKNIFTSTCVTEGGRSGGSYPSQPWMSCISPHSTWCSPWAVNLWTQSWLQRHQPHHGESCSTQPWPWGKQRPGRLSQEHLFRQNPCRSWGSRIHQKLLPSLPTPPGLQFHPSNGLHETSAAVGSFL